MASAINNGTFEFNKHELNDISKIINELTFGDKDLSQIHAIEQGIKHDMQIVLSTYGGLLGKQVGANCTPNEITGITLSEKVWQPVFEDFRLKHCTTDVTQQDKLINQMTKMNADFYSVVDGSQKSVGDFLIATVIARFKENLLYKVWFDDKTAETITDGGVFKNGTDITYFTGFNGLFKQIFAEAKLSSGGKYFTSIAKNAGVSYAAQALADGDAIAAFKSTFNKADSRLRGLPDAKFLATRSLYDGLVNDLESKENTGGGITMINKDGVSVLTYRGIEVYMMDIWDRFIDTYQNNGTKWNLPHRLVLTVSDNIPVGTLAVDDFGKLDAFYDRYHKVNVIDAVYSIDAKLLEDYKTSVAY